MKHKPYLSFDLPTVIEGGLNKTPVYLLGKMMDSELGDM